MSIRVRTKINPTRLLHETWAAIDEGHIKKWAHSAEGGITHTAHQWDHQAWFHPDGDSENLVFSLLAPEGKQLTHEQYTYYHARLAEVLLEHFADNIVEITISAKPRDEDKVNRTIQSNAQIIVVHNAPTKRTVRFKKKDTGEK